MVRREFDVSEGDAFNQVLIQRAKKRLEALDYFEKVDISAEPGSEPDHVVVVVNLVEKSSGEFSIGAGYSTGATPGPTVEGSITERNSLVPIRGGPNAASGTEAELTRPRGLSERPKSLLHGSRLVPCGRRYLLYLVPTTRRVFAAESQKTFRHPPVTHLCGSRRPLDSVCRCKRRFQAL